MRDLLLIDRVIVAADYRASVYGGRAGVRQKILALAKELEGTNVIIKINSALRALGYDLVDRLRDLGVRVCADLKIVDIPETMELDAEFLNEVTPAMLTVMCQAGVPALKRLRGALDGSIEVLGVTVLTSLDREECLKVHGREPLGAVASFAQIAAEAGLDGLVLSGKENSIIRDAGLHTRLTRNNPGVRTLWSLVPNDDQSRVVTPDAAIKSGADRIIIGRPVTGCKPSDDLTLPQSPREALIQVYDEVQTALSSTR